MTESIEKTLIEECIEKVKRKYKEEWENGNPLSPEEFSRLLSLEIITKVINPAIEEQLKEVDEK